MCQPGLGSGTVTGYRGGHMLVEFDNDGVERKFDPQIAKFQLSNQPAPARRGQAGKRKLGPPQPKRALRNMSKMA